MELISIQNQLTKMEEIKIESKRETDFVQINFPKTDHYQIEIMAALIQNESNLPKSFRNVCPRDSMLKSFRNRFKTVKEIDFGQD